MNMLAETGLIWGNLHTVKAMNFIGKSFWTFPEFSLLSWAKGYGRITMCLFQSFWAFFSLLAVKKYGIHYTHTRASFQILLSNSRWAKYIMTSKAIGIYHFWMSLRIMRYQEFSFWFTWIHNMWKNIPVSLYWPRS